MDIPVSGGIATYRGKQYPIAFTGEDWIALRADGGPEFPDAIDAGESRFEPGHYRPWVKVALRERECTGCCGYPR